MHIHLTKETRIKFSALLLAGNSLRQAAKLLGVHHSTLIRELQRNTPVQLSQYYHLGDAHRKTQSRRRSANQHSHKIIAGSRLESLITSLLRVHKWAPEQIAGWLKATRKAIYVCAQTIYDWIYYSRRELLVYLHCRKGKYRRTRTCKIRKEQRRRAESMRSIDNRPKHVDERKMYGDWEGDNVHGVG